MSLLSFCGRRAVPSCGLWLVDILVSRLSPDAFCSLSSSSCNTEQYFSTSEFRLLTDPLLGIDFSEFSGQCLLEHFSLWFSLSQCPILLSPSSAATSWVFSPSDDRSGWLSSSPLLMSAVSECRLSLSVVSWYSSELWQYGHFPDFL